MSIAQPSFQHMLRHWRGVRRMSQLGLATDAGISARHLCFLETGRSQPSREMVRLLAQVLDIPLAEQNALLVAAGFAPVFGARGLEAPELAPIQQALDFMLTQQEPYPALVLDEGWTIRQRNAATSRVFGPLRQAYDMPEALSSNVMHVLCHPAGLRPFMRNWQEFVYGFMQVLHREASQGLSQKAANLHAELMCYPGMAEGMKQAEAARADAPMAVMHLRRGAQELSFFVTLTSFAMPRDVTLQQIKIECFFPADAATAAAVKKLAATA